MSNGDQPIFQNVKQHYDIKLENFTNCKTLLQQYSFLLTLLCLLAMTKFFLLKQIQGLQLYLGFVTMV